MVKADQDDPQDKEVGSRQETFNGLYNIPLQENGAKQTRMGRSLRFPFPRASSLFAIPHMCLSKSKWIDRTWTYIERKCAGSIESGLAAIKIDMDRANLDRRPSKPRWIDPSIGARQDDKS